MNRFYQLQGGIRFQAAARVYLIQLVPQAGQEEKVL
jgi:hypothetical protein